MTDSYSLRLLSEIELLSRAESVYSSDSLLSKEYTLDSARFGATRASPVCSVCKQHIEKCIGHYAVIKLPFPIPVVIAQKDFKTVVSIICPVCSHLLVSKDVLAKSMNLAPEVRLAWIKKETLKLTDNQRKAVQCPNCNTRVMTISITSESPQWRFEVMTSTQGYADQINPIQIHIMLKNFSQIDEIGFPSTYHPANFMTSFIPIVPNKLRPKTLMSAESNVTTYYKNIITEICPELERIKKQLNLGSSVEIPRGQIQTDFNKNYDKLIAYYSLITDIGTQRTKDSEMNLINRRDRKYVEQTVSLLTRLKSKHNKSLWKDGIVGTRHDNSCRTVLGGATKCFIHEIQLPEHVATRMSMMYPVYAQNLEAMRQLVAQQANTLAYDDGRIPKVIYVHSSFNERTTEVNARNALSKAALLRAGDKVGISLTNADWVLECRYPVLCEEGWAAFKVYRDNTSPILKVPFSDLKKQGADLDGDEVQAYAMKSHLTDIECNVLYSIYRQFVSYKTGGIMTWFGQGASTGVSQMTIDRYVSVHNGKHIPSTKVIDIISKLLPPDLSYNDAKITIEKGKIKDKCNLSDQELFKYIAFKYGNRIATDLLSRITNIAYDVIRDNGNTLGFEITIPKKDLLTKVREIREDTRKHIFEIEKTTEPDIIKTIKELHELANQKVYIQKLLIEGMKGTSLDENGFIKERLEEFYHMVVELDYLIIDGARAANVLSEGTRTCCCYPRWSIDPRAYGFVDRSYTEGIDAYTHMLDCKLGRNALYIKGQGVAKQGYFSKRIAVAVGNNVANWNHQVDDGYKIVSPRYGSIGADPRRACTLKLNNLDMSHNDFAKKYSKDKRLIELHAKINANQSRYRRLTNFVQNDNITNTFSSLYQFDQFFAHEFN